MLSSAEKDDFIFISPGFSRSLVWLFSLFHARARSLLLPLSCWSVFTLVMSFCTRALMHSPILQVTMCPELGCKSPMQKISCLCLQRFRVSLHQRRARSCSMESYFFLCILFSTSEPTTNIWPTFKFQHLVQPCFGLKVTINYYSPLFPCFGTVVSGIDKFFLHLICTVSKDTRLDATIARTLIK